jgi:hypothetical protein
MVSRVLGRHRMDRWVTLNAWEVQHLTTREIAVRCWANFDCGEMCERGCPAMHQCSERAGPGPRAAQIGLCDEHYRKKGAPLADRPMA